jgi:hypothetical protein
MNIGVGDFGMARTNAMLALDAGKRNASQFRTAGKYAVQYGMMSAAAGAFTGASQAFEAGGNPFAKLFSTTPSTLPNANTRSGAQ